MSWFQRLFSSDSNSSELTDQIKVDMHCHLLPGIDDGVESFDEALDMIRKFAGFGYKKIIITPHIMGDFYKNTPEGINAKLQELKKLLVQNNIEMELDAAAEYYLDEWFIASLKKSDSFMTFGKINKYLLFETSYINESSQLFEAIFEMRASGYTPVLAHPERYTYLYSSFNRFIDLKDKGTLFQLNINSISGYYSEAAQKFAEKLINNNMVDFIGSDCHGVRHMHALDKSVKTRLYSKLLKLDLLNNSLL